MGAETPIREDTRDTIECEINGEIVEVGGIDVFDGEGLSDEAICAITEDVINQEALDREREDQEINQMIADGTFSG